MFWLFWTSQSCHIFPNSTDDMAELITWPHTWVFESNFLRSVLKVNKPFNLLQWKIDNINQLTGENIFSGFFPIGLMFLELCTSSFKVQTTVNNESSKCCQKATFSKISPLQQGVLPLTVNWQYQPINCKEKSFQAIFWHWLDF